METNKDNQKGILKINRVIKYVLFIISSFIIPFALTSIIISSTGNREEGMGYGFSIPFLVVNLVFAFFIIKSNIVIKILTGLIVTITTLGVMWIVMTSGIFESKNDMYGIWGAMFTYIFTSVISWELTYRTIEMIKKNKNAR